MLRYPGLSSGRAGRSRISTLFCLDILLEINLSDVQEQSEDAVPLLSRKNLSLKGNVWVCVSHIYAILLYLYSVLSRRHPFYSPEGGLVMPSFDILQYTLRVVFLEWMSSQADGNGKFWKENANKKSLSLRCVQSCEKVHWLTQDESSFYFECKLRAKDVLSGVSGVVA